jgi:hypothetical protein
MSGHDDSLDLSFKDLGDLDVSSIAFSQNWSRHDDDRSISFLKDPSDPKLSIILPSNSVEPHAPDPKAVHKQSKSEDTAPTQTVKQSPELEFRLDREAVPVSCSDCLRETCSLV